MQNIDWSVISASISAFTAIIAILAPAATSYFSNKSQEKIKKMELYNSRVYDALAELSRTYSAMSLSIRFFSDEEGSDNLRFQAHSRCVEFRSACFKIISLVPVPSVQEKISALLDHIGISTYVPDKKDDVTYCGLVADINEYLISSKVKK